MTRAFLRRAVVLLVALGGMCAPGTAAAQEHACPVPVGFYTFDPFLPKVTQALAEGQEVNIVALGGASTLGRAAGGAAFGWPARMASALAAQFPSARIKAVNLAVARQTAEQAAARLDRDVLPLKPMLVIWETGTMEAVRGTTVDEFRETVQDGIDDLRGAGAEVVLMDMQFSRRTSALINFEPYLAALRELAYTNGIPLFPRHALMRLWAEDGVLDLGVKDREKRRQLAAKVYDCIGRAMADFITRKPRPPGAHPTRRQ